MSNYIFLKIAIAIVLVILPNIGGWLGGILVQDNLDWFDKLNKPKWNPPNWAFAPAWTIIYCCMGLASYLVFQDLCTAGKGFNRKAGIAFLLYTIQLALNWAWTPLFFKFHLLNWVSNTTPLPANILLQSMQYLSLKL